MTTRFDSKDPGETITLAFDFRNLGSGAPAAPTVEIAVLTGADPTPAAMLASAATVLNGWVYQRIAGGADGTDYAIRCFADVGSGNRMLVDGILPVRSRPTPRA